MSDVCLLLEGIYLRVSGGVSVWVDSLIRSLPDVTFSILHVSPSEDRDKPYVREMPPNVVEVREVFPFDYEATKGGVVTRRARAWTDLQKCYESMIAGDSIEYGPLLDLVYGPNRPLSTHDLAFSKQAWDVLQDLYKKTAPNYSFIDFFWSWRLTHMPLMKLLDVEFPAAKVYHAVSTGYAGFLGALAKHQGAEKYIVTEHGIYTRERNLEITQADWIHEPEMDEIVVRGNQGLVKTWWQAMFGTLAHMAYTYADQIVTLFEGNRLHQLAGGADPDKTMIVPNGIANGRYDRPRNGNGNRSGKTVGYMGRVVPIKDVMTFLRAAKIVGEQVPDTRFLVMGSLDEDPEYVTKCRRLVNILGLEDSVTFTGPITPEEYYPELDAIVLTSLSEGQPLSLIEAMAAGVPVVATRVGACQELIQGRTKEDAELGPSGLVTDIAAPAETAEAIGRLLTRRDLARAMGTAGRERAARFYRLDSVAASYRELYQSTGQETP